LELECLAREEATREAAKSGAMELPLAMAVLGTLGRTAKTISPMAATVDVAAMAVLAAAALLVEPEEEEEEGPEARSSLLRLSFQGVVRR
jgi:hypothetical protein